MNTSGTVYFDAFESRTGSHIGPVAFIPRNGDVVRVNGAGKVQAALAPMPLQNSLSVTFLYDGDGNRVAQTINGVTTYFIGNYFEQTGSTITKYYYADTQRVAMRVNGALYFLLSDHLGSTSLTTDAGGNVISELRYTAWGQVRYSSGTTLTQYTYTGQYSNVSEFGLMYYNARWYDPSLGRFAQADAIVPGGVQGYDRYAYVNNDPVRYTDPSGNRPCNGDFCQEDAGGISGKGVPPPQSPNSSPHNLVNSQYNLLWDNWSAPDACKFLVGSADNPICPDNLRRLGKSLIEPGPYSIQSAMDLLTDPSTLADELSFSSTSLGFHEAITEVHVPIIGFGLDYGAQWLRDSNNNFSLGQRVTRATLLGLEGQLISMPAAGAVGALSVLDIPTTGPIGLSISATVYITINEAGSRTFNNWNESFWFPKFQELIP